MSPSPACSFISCSIRSSRSGEGVGEWGSGKAGKRDGVRVAKRPDDGSRGLQPTEGDRWKARVASRRQMISLKDYFRDQISRGTGASLAGRRVTGSADSL